MIILRIFGSERFHYSCDNKTLTSDVPFVLELVGKRVDVHADPTGSTRAIIADDINGVCLENNVHLTGTFPEVKLIMCYGDTHFQHEISDMAFEALDLHAYEASKIDMNHCCVTTELKLTVRAEGDVCNVHHLYATKIVVN